MALAGLARAPVARVPWAEGSVAKDERASGTCLAGWRA